MQTYQSVYCFLGPYAWENTLHQLKNKKKSGINYGKVRDLCPSMDPDASIRTKKPLADEDKEDENRLFRHIFNLLRAGQLDRGKEAAQKLGTNKLSDECVKFNRVYFLKGFTGWQRLLTDGCFIMIPII